MQRNSLWILNHYALPNDSAGGTRHFDFARELGKRGIEATIFASNVLYTTRQERHTLKHGQAFRQECIDGVNFVWLRTFPYQRNDGRRLLNMLSYTWRAVRVGYSWPTSPQVIIGSSVHPFAALAGYLLARRHHARFFFEVRDLWPQTLVDLGYFSPRHPLVLCMRLLETWLYQHAEKIIVLLPKAVEYITSLGFPAAKVIHIPNGVPLDSEPSAGSLPEALQGLKDRHRFLVAYAGAHGIANGLDVILDAAQRLKASGNPEIAFVFIGDGPEKERLAKKASDRQLDALFLGPVPKAATPRLLRAMDALVFPLRPSPVFKYGISSNKIFDYMASGRPIIFSAEAGNNPVAEAGCGLSVPPGDPGALAEAVLQLHRLSPEERRALGARGRQSIEQHYSIPVLVDRLCAALEFEPSIPYEPSAATGTQASL